MGRNELFSRLFVFCAAACPLVCAAPVWAQQAPLPAPAAYPANTPDSSYAQYFGDGLRQFGEGNYGRAIPNLLRAYALDSKAETLSLVIASYDKMGFCDAAARQTQVFEAVHAGEDTPSPERCAQAGTVELECVGATGPLVGEPARVDGQFDVGCGQSLRFRLVSTKFRSARGAQRPRGERSMWLKGPRFRFVWSPSVSRSAGARRAVQTYANWPISRSMSNGSPTRALAIPSF